MVAARVLGLQCKNLKKLICISIFMNVYGCVYPNIVVLFLSLLPFGYVQEDSNKNGGNFKQLRLK
jgi:hypothetical protein